MFDVPDAAAKSDGRRGRPTENGADSPPGVNLTGASKAAVTLPAVLDVEEAGRLLGLGRSAAYQLVKNGAWPTPVLRLGRRWRVPTGPLLALLGIEGLQPSAADGRLRPSPTAPAIFRHDQGDQR